MITKWLSAEAVSAKRERRRMERRWQWTRKEEDRLEYRRVCRTTNKLINKSRQDYYQMTVYRILTVDFGNSPDEIC